MEVGVISATLSLVSPTDGTSAQTLTLTMTFYQNGILRVLIEEPNGARFRISQEDLPVVDNQLVPVDLTDLVEWSANGTSFTVKGLNS